MSKNMNVPKLRFSEFSGEWEEKKLGNILTFKNGINANKEQYGKGFKFINVLDIINNNTIKFENIIGSVNVSEEVFEKNKVGYGDILFQRSSEVREEAGQSSVYLDKDDFSTFGGFVIRGQGIVDYVPEFMNYMFKTSHSRKEITQKSNGSTRYNVGQDTLSKVIVYTTSLPEQEKIASFLSSIDIKIEQLTKKESLLQEYKKGVMQKIFNQEIRFKADDGSAFCDWEEKKLGEVTYKTSKKNKDNISYPVYSINNKNGFIPQSEQFEGMDSNDRNYDISLYKIIQNNTFAYNPSRINVGSLGYSGELNNIIISSLYVCFKTNEDINDKFLLQYFSTFEFNKSVLRNTEGGVRDYLFYENFSKIKVNFPSFKEQNKIENFLSSIDKKIEHTKTQLEKTKEFKKSLLQRMFV